MDIGLSLKTPSRGTAGVGPPPPATLQPLPGILDATNVVVMGASIMQATFGNPVTPGDPVTAEMQAYAQAAGFTGNFVTYAQSGDKVVDTIAKIPGAKADVIADQGSNLYIVHSGGNDVSSRRPYPNYGPELTADYDTLIGDIANTDKVLPLPLTKRLYGIEDAGYPNNPDDVEHGNPASEANGSRPYNIGVFHPAVASHAPDWVDASGAPYVNPYEVADRHPDVLSDGTHGYNRVLARYIIVRMAGRALGLPKGASRAGKSILYAIEKDTTSNMAMGPVNRFCSNKNFSGYPIMYGAVFTDGSLDPFISVRTSDDFRNGSSTDGSLAYPRLADTRFHTPDVADQGIYLEPGSTYTLDFDDVTPGDTVTVSCCGIRNAGGTARRADVTLTGGQTLVLDAANIAASNQIVFQPVVVPPSGQISLTVQVTAGSNYGYLHGVILDFS